MINKFFSFTYLASFLIFFVAQSVYAADFSVTNNNDSGAGSLRQAVIDANSNAEADTINFDNSLSGSTITLVSGELEVTSEIIINGLGAEQLIISGNNSSRIFNVESQANLTLNSLTITEGRADSSDLNDPHSGGGIRCSGCILNINECIITNNEAVNEDGDTDVGLGGGAISVLFGELEIARSILSNNRAISVVNGIDASGGAIHVSTISSRTNITDSIISGNTVSSPIRSFGAAIAARSEIAINNSTISNNRATSTRLSIGGGLFLSDPNALIRNSTISGNISEGVGISGRAIGGAMRLFQGTTNIYNSTIANNQAINEGNSTSGGGIVLTNSSINAVLNIESTIVAGNVADSENDISQNSGDFTSLNSLIGDSDGHLIINGVDNNIVGVDPLLGPLSDNGGLTQTHALLVSSPAINAGTNSQSLTTDQRGEGFNRVIGLATDIGAVEYGTTAEVRGSSGLITGTVDLGVIELGNNSTQETFEIVNLGFSDIALVSNPRVTISGSEFFSVSELPDNLILSQSSSSFSILVNALEVGVFSAQVNLDFNEPNEDITFTIQAEVIEAADNDNDLIPDNADPDDDNDGVSDEQEMIDGTNSFDPSSFVFRLDTTICADWNGFIGQEYNILEITNNSSSSREVNVQLFDINGALGGSLNGTIDSGLQLDVLVHDMTGFQIDAIGTVCIEVVNGSPGDIDGRMLYYKPVVQGTFAPFEYVLSQPLQNPLQGVQYVPFNTFHPSLDPQDINNFVANWVTLVNQESDNQTGSLLIYDINGNELMNEAVSINSNQRRDYPIHAVGVNQIGLVVWEPSDRTKKARVTLNRYIYDGDTPLSNVKDAVTFSGQKGSLDSLFAVADTRSSTSVIEVSNTSSSNNTLNVVTTDAGGREVINLEVPLKAFATRHIILDLDLVEQIGNVKVSSLSSMPFSMNLMQYERKASLSLESLFPIVGSQPIGTHISGSYNTFLSQGCSLLLANSRSADENIVLNATRFDGTRVLMSEGVVVPANGAVEFNLCGVDQQDSYGRVQVSSTNANTITGNIVRLGQGYRLSSPVR